MTIRIALALLAIVPAAMAYPWQANTDRWTLGIAAVVVLAVFAWWRGQFVTTMIGRRLAVWRRNHSTPRPRQLNKVTVLLRVEDPLGVGLPLPLLAGYVERFGVRCEKVRVTSRDCGDARTTWIGVTLDAADNLAALQARSPELPLRETAEIVGRRLVDHLRETGLEAAIVDAQADADTPLSGDSHERWGSVRDDRGFVSAYGLPVDERFAERLSAVWSQPLETWTAVEFTGTSTHPAVTAMCALRTAKAVHRAPISGLVTHRGIQRLLLTALDPMRVERLGVPSTPLPPGVVEHVDWRAGSTTDLSRT